MKIKTGVKRIIDGIEEEIFIESYEARYPYRHTTKKVIGEATAKGKRSAGYQKIKHELRDDFVSDITDSWYMPESGIPMKQKEKINSILNTLPNPLTKSETLNVRREAEIHRRIKGTPVKSAYYQGMANGMTDIADEYGIPGRRRMNPPQYKHERIVSPRTLAKHGLTKYRSVKTPSGDIVRIAFPPGRRRAGSGEVQAILHKRNPPVEIYSRVKEVIAQKGPGHKCDAACKRAHHMYRHVFKEKAGIYGNPDGSLTIE